MQKTVCIPADGLLHTVQETAPEIRICFQVKRQGRSSVQEGKRTMAGRHSRTRRTARKRSCRKQRHPFLSFCAGCLCLAGICFGAYLWLESVQDILPQLEAEQVSAGEFRPQVGEPPYRVVVDAGHGGADPGAQGVLVEKDVTAETASVLLQWLTADPNYIPLQTRDDFEQTATPSERAARAREQAPQLLLSIHANSAANGSGAAGFECYPAVPGRTWHNESFYFAQRLAEGMQAAGEPLRGYGGVRYIYYLENDQKQLVENTHTEIRPERSFTLLEDVDCPAVLAEQCFVTSEADVARLGTKEGCARAARIYYEAICAYFGTEPAAG